MAALRTRYSLDSRSDHLCRQRPWTRRGIRAWNKLLRVIAEKSHVVDVQTLTMAIEQLDALHADPEVRRRAIAAAAELLDCPQGLGTEAELLMIALGASAFEIDEEEARVPRETLQASRMERMETGKGTEWYEQAEEAFFDLDAIAIAMYEPPPLPAESALYPVNKSAGGGAPSAPPRVCLALSGGGIRSAAFQIGVLQGLRERNLLPKVDLISAVSGGGYAMSWFIASRLKEAGVRTDFPKGRGDFGSAYYYPDFIAGSESQLRDQTAASPQPPSPSPSPSPPPPSLPYAFLDESRVSIQDVRFARLVSPLEGLFLAVAGLPAALVEAPYDSLESNLPSFLLEHRNYTRLLQTAYFIPDYPLAGLARRLARVPDLAYPIFSATAHTGACAEDSSPTLGFAANLRTSSFELAPSGVGPTASELSSTAPYLYTVADAAAISGAAIDVPFGRGCSALEKAQVRLGARLPGPKGTLRYVTDGGFFDNLALTPLLLRRDCQAIIVADAEQDPHLTFASYERLDEALQRQQIGALEVPDIERLAGETSRSCVPEDFPPCFTTSKAGKDAPRRSRHEERGWFTGRVRMTGASEGEGIPLLYLKMTVDESMQGSYPEPVTAAMDWRCNRPDCEFPHIPTTRQWLPEVQFRGLRHLGRHLVGQAVKSSAWPPAGPGDINDPGDSSRSGDP